METGLPFAGFEILALIIGLITLAKRLTGYRGDGWLGVALVLGMVSAVCVEIINTGSPGDFAGIFRLLIVGLAYGLAACKLYDVALDEEGLVAYWLDNRL